jgi:hypothetical protein
MNEQAIRLASKFIESRDVLRRLHGEKYAVKSEAYQAAIRAIMKLKDCNEIDAVKYILETAKRDSVPSFDSGMLAMWLLAAALDISESATPSKR